MNVRDLLSCLGPAWLWAGTLAVCYWLLDTQLAALPAGQRVALCGPLSWIAGLIAVVVTPSGRASLRDGAAMLRALRPPARARRAAPELLRGSRTARLRDELSSRAMMSTLPGRLGTSLSRRTSFTVALALAMLPAAAFAQAPLPARAPASEAESSPNAADGSRRDRFAGLELLASVAYGTPTQKVFRIALEPYGASFGLEPGFTFRNRVRLGAYTQYSLGGAVDQRYDPILGPDFDLTAEASSLHAGVSLGYDLQLYFLVLRYALNLGFTRSAWDFNGERRSVYGFSSDKGVTFGFHVTPALALLWPIRMFECGLGVDYLIQAEDSIPMGVMGKLLVGVRR